MTPPRRTLPFDLTTNDADELLYYARRLGLSDVSIDVVWRGSDITRRRVEIRYVVASTDVAGEIRASSLAAGLRKLVRRLHTSGSSPLLTRRTRRARPCDRCDRTIEPGEPYARIIDPPRPGVSTTWGPDRARCETCTLEES